jgi:hypothetical protein
MIFLTHPSTYHQPLVAIRFACLKCNTPYTLNDQTAGSEIDCPACGQRLRVPDRQAVVAIAAGPTPTSAIFVGCPYCGHQAQAPAHYAGKEARCPKCRQTFVAPSLGPPPPIVEPLPPPEPVVEYRRSDWDLDEWEDDRPVRRRRRSRPRERDGFRCPYCNTSASPTGSREFRWPGGSASGCSCSSCASRCAGSAC